MKIALAFSGGGVRATVFHLGVLASLARQNLLSDVNVISSVSGGSLAAGLVFAANGNRWPDGGEYLHKVVPQIHQLLTTKNVQWSYMIKSLMFPWRLVSGRAAVLGNELERHWGISGQLADLPVTPRWVINATCYETGKNWRFQRDLMGDYQTKYVANPDIKLSHALAASAAVPGLIGPLVVKSQRHQWCEMEPDGRRPIEPKYQRLQLWDGGVYDNLGVEALFKPGLGICEDADFLLVCDASRPLTNQIKNIRWRPRYLESSMRLVDIATDQVRSLRGRMLVDHFIQNPGSGAYLKMGRRNKRLKLRRRSDDQPTLTDTEVDRVAAIETTLRRLRNDEFSLLFRHGFEVAGTTLTKHCKSFIQQRSASRVKFPAA